MQSAINQHSILVVDDNRVNLEVMATLLARMGYHCTLASSGEQALQLLKEQVFDLVLMDCMMPSMNGIEATRHFKAPEGPYLDRTTPVIALTAQVTHENRENCKRAGMVGFLEKPINRASLQSVIRQCLHD